MKGFFLLITLPGVLRLHTRSTLVDFGPKADTKDPSLTFVLLAGGVLKHYNRDCLQRSHTHGLGAGRLVWMLSSTLREATRGY